MVHTSSCIADVVSDVGPVDGFVILDTGRCSIISHRVQSPITLFDSPNMPEAPHYRSSNVSNPCKQLYNGSCFHSGHCFYMCNGKSNKRTGFIFSSLIQRCTSCTLLTMETGQCLSSAMTEHMAASNRDNRASLLLYHTH